MFEQYWFAGKIGIPLIPGIIVAWSGTIGSIPIGWKLCDGTNATIGGNSVATPNFSGGLLTIGAGTTYAQNTTYGSSSGQGSSTTTTDGTHGIGGTQNCGNGNFSGGQQYNQQPGGAHSHTVSYNITPAFPPNTQTRYIVATDALFSSPPARLPAGSIVIGGYTNKPVPASTDYITSGFLLGTTTDGSAASGSNTKSLSGGTVLSAGNHQHPPASFNGDIRCCCPCIDKYSAGAHTHNLTGITPGTAVFPEPPFYVVKFRQMLAPLTVIPYGAIVGYIGSSGALGPAKYQLANGTNGTPDLRNRIPKADSGNPIGTTGGSLANITGDVFGVNGQAVDSVDAFHNHISGGGSGINDSAFAFGHTGQSWVHQHTINGGTFVAQNFPPCVGMTFICPTPP